MSEDQLDVRIPSDPVVVCRPLTVFVPKVPSSSVTYFSSPPSHAASPTHGHGGHIHVADLPTTIWSSFELHNNDNNGVAMKKLCLFYDCLNVVLSIEAPHILLSYFIRRDPMR